MTAVPVPYDSFISSPQASHDLGGPWTISKGNEVNSAQCLSNNYVYCDGICLECDVFPPDDQQAYHPMWTANISIDMSKYTDQNNLNVSWSYWPLYVDQAVTANTVMTGTSRVGNQNFTDTFPASDQQTFFNVNHQWNDAAKISHNTSISVTKGADGKTAYVPLAMRFVITPSNNNSYINWVVKGVQFRITSTPIPTTPSTSAAPLPTNSSATNPSPSSSSASSTAEPAFAQASSSQPSGGVIAGAVIASLAGVILILFAILFWRRKQSSKGNGKPEEKDPPPRSAQTITPFTQSDSPPEKGRRPPHPSGEVDLSPRLSLSEPGPSPWVIPAASGHANGQPPPHSEANSSAYTGYAEAPVNTPPSGGWAGPRSPMSFYSGVGTSVREEPPVYGSNGPLTMWARENRSAISEDMEVRLSAAGYVPSDDPDSLTEEEWRTRYGITKLELLRLRRLYAESQR